MVSLILNSVEIGCPEIVLASNARSPVRVNTFVPGIVVSALTLNGIVVPFGIVKVDMENPGITKPVTMFHPSPGL